MTKIEYEAWRGAVIKSDAFASSQHRIQMLAIWDGEDAPREDYFHIQKQFNDVFLGFGNGCYEEVRVVGANAGSIVAFCRVVEIGGYEFTDKLPRNAKLHVSGDLCFPDPDPFIFVCLKPDPELVDAANTRYQQRLHEARKLHSQHPPR